MIKHIIYANNQASLIDKINRLDPTERYLCEIKPHKSQRSLAQNKWARAYAKDLGAHLGYEPDEMYEILMYKFNPVFITDKETGEQIRLAGHFSKLRTNEAAEVQDKIQRWSAGLGFFWDE